MKTIQEVSAESRLLYGRLREASTGETITYQELSVICGRNVQHEGRGNLTTARRMAQRNDNKVFGVVINEGVKLLGDQAIVDSCYGTSSKIRRMAKREAIRQTCVEDFDALSSEHKARHNAAISMYGALSLMTRQKQILKLEEAVKDAQAKLPLKKTLELFSG